MCESRRGPGEGGVHKPRNIGRQEPVDKGQAIRERRPPGTLEKAVLSMRDQAIVSWPIATVLVIFSPKMGKSCMRTSIANPTSRQNGLELLRAIAVLLVVLRHMSNEAIPTILKPLHNYGWMGVDLFFVLSGYLIGCQLLNQLASGGRPSLGTFYARRAFRVLPAFLVVLGLYFFIPQFREQPQIASGWRFLTFTMNLGLDPTKTGAFSHAWSLCVEEYFYLVFPLLVMALWYRPSPAVAISAAFAIAAFGMLVRLLSWKLYVDPLVAGDDDARSIAYSIFIYYPTYTRLDGLLIGVILSAMKTFWPDCWRWAMNRGHSLALVGTALISLAVWLASDRMSLSSAIFGFPVLSAGLGFLLVSSVSTNGVLARIRVPGASIFATLAYSLYLTHKEVMHLDRIFVLGWLPMNGLDAFLVYGATSFAAAWLLYYVIERPSLRLRDRFLGRRRMAAMTDWAGSRL